MSHGANLFLASLGELLNASTVKLAAKALESRSFTEAGNPISWWKLAAHRPVIFRANFADVSKGTECAFGICISMQCEGDGDDWVEIFTCSAFLEGCSNGSLCAMQSSCGCALLALASLLSSRPVRSWVVPACYTPACGLPFWPIQLLFCQFAAFIFPKFVFVGSSTVKLTLPDGVCLRLRRL